MKPQPPPPQNHERTNINTTPSTGGDTPMALNLDIETYLSQLEDWDAPDEKKKEFIQTLWALLLTFAEIGFEIHPSQQAAKEGRKPSIKSPKTPENPSVLPPDVVYSRPYFRTQIIQNTDAKTATDIEELNIEERPS